jgi:hypothetical protein
MARPPYVSPFIEMLNDFFRGTPHSPPDAHGSCRRSIPSREHFASIVGRLSGEAW